MNSLDELFGEALSREALDTTAAQRAAVADVTVRGARRRRRVRAASQAVGVVAAVGLALGVGSLVLNDADAPPAVTPTPAPTTPAPEPSGPVTDFKADPRMPQAPPMTPDDWARADGTWDVELASFDATVRETKQSTVAIYLTGPDGTRRLAYSDAQFPIVQPILLAFDPGTKVVTLFDEATRVLYSLDLDPAAVSEISWQLEDDLRGAAPLGRDLDGSSIVAVETVADDGSITSSLYRMGEDSGSSFWTGAYEVSPVWGDKVVVYEGEVTYVVSTTGETTREFTDLPGCNFVKWNFNGWFTVHCPTSQDRTGSYLDVDPLTGATIEQWEDVAVESLESTTDEFDAIAFLTTGQSIDGYRVWDGLALSGTELNPPVVYDNAIDVTTDLSDDFANTPDTYSVIFGPRY